MTQVELLELEFIENQGDLANSLYKVGTQIMRLTKKTLVATYDFAVLGGAVSTVNLKGIYGSNVVIPKGAIVTSCIIDVITALTSGGLATVALGTGQAGNDLKAALAFDSYTALVAGVPVGSAATSIKMTADRTMTATIATAALTAGKINVLVEYYVSI